LCVERRKPPKRGLGGREDEFGWPPEEAIGFERSAPAGMRMIRNDEIDATIVKKTRRFFYDSRCVLRQCQAVHDRTKPHIAKVFVAPHLSVEEHSPSDDIRSSANLQAEETLAFRIQDVQGCAVAGCNEGVMLAALLPEIVSPNSKIAHQLRDLSLIRRS